eukprot:Skav203891  [mRNA]  locus=scaffold1649:123882:124521:- [translate_table: standard]
MKEAHPEDHLGADCINELQTSSVAQVLDTSKDRIEDDHRRAASLVGPAKVGLEGHLSSPSTALAQSPVPSLALLT